MLFNQILNNTDDHLRNFSFSCREDGWQLSPAYDVVPSLSRGQFHQLKVGYNDYLPDISNAISFHSNFHLTKQAAAETIERVYSVAQKWRAIFEQHGVSDNDITRLEKVIRV